MGVADDDTLRLTPQPAPPPGRRPAKALIAGGLLVVLASLGGIGAWVWSQPDKPARPSAAMAPSTVAPAVPPALPSAIAPTLPVPPATAFVRETDLPLLLPAQPAMHRLMENPRVFILIFPDLETQGAALNRAAALIEKAGLPRDRVLTPLELELAIRASGDTAATWFLGHDYRGSDLARFYALAERDRIPLNEAELWVREQLVQAAAEVGDGPLALVSTANPGPRLDAAMRATVLRHEIGHGHYFTVPGFAEQVLATWRDRFSEADRSAFRGFLAREGYDSQNEALMANETMAYLLFTPDPRFFAPAMVGMTEPAVEQLRGLLRDRLPRP